MSLFYERTVVICVGPMDFYLLLVCGRLARSGASLAGEGGPRVYGIGFVTKSTLYPGILSEIV